MTARRACPCGRVRKGRRMAPDAVTIEQVLGAVVDPVLGLALEETGMLASVRTRRHRAEIELALPTADWPERDDLVAALEAAALSNAEVREAGVAVSVMDDAARLALRGVLRRRMGEGAEEAHGHDHGPPAPAFLQAGSGSRVVGVASGKGGVGKSSVTVNLAIALARSGHAVGILDADVYGFSVPKMLGGGDHPVVLGDLVVPTSVHGVRCLSMGYFVPEDQPVIWRGPMLHKAIEQFVADAWWGRPDFLLVDMPPGTGDVTLSLAQVMPRAEVLVVTTPQSAAERVAQRAAYAARKLKLAVRGVVENMSWFTADDGTRYELFGNGGGAQLAKDLGVPLLGQVPFVPAMREGGDAGTPVTVSDPDSEASAAFSALADRLVALGPARVYRRELSLR
jgi:ATP-binding protein involved in chromosome partitioning